MRRIALAVGVLCAVGLTGRGTAQFNTTSSGGGGGAMPGKVVGSFNGQVTPVGKQAPAAAPQNGQSITANAMQRPYDPNNPYAALKGTGIDPGRVVAPVTGPDGKPVVTPDRLDQLSESIKEKVKAFFGLNTPPPRPAFAPGIGRRSQERVENRTWRRD